MSRGGARHGQKVTLSPEEIRQAERIAEARDRDPEAAITRIDQFVRADIPPRLRPFEGVHNVGHIRGDDGQTLTLIRSDQPPQTGRFETPCIAFLLWLAEGEAKFVEHISPANATKLASLLLVREAGTARGATGVRFDAHGDGSASVVVPPDFEASLTPAAAEAFAVVLDEFAEAHR